MTLASGTRLGPYEILSPLGAGGMGEVYRARDSRLGRDVAVKVLPEEFLEGQERRERFEREARLLAALNHPGIAAVYSFEEVSDSSLSSPTSRHILVLELIEGETLRARLAGEALPVRRLLAWATQIAEGLAKAHASGIVHRDLKPENVMVTREGVVKILDFGLAKLTGPSAGNGERTQTVSALTETGVVLGTVVYMSPEQARGETLDFRSDQFSFGSILYEMITGRRAFPRPSAPETMTAIIREEPEALSVAAPATPVPLRWIVERCLAKDPEERYASTRDLARDLARLRDGLSEATSSGAVPAAPEARRNSRRGLLVAAAVVLAAAAAAGVVLTRPRREPTVWRPLTFRRGSIGGARFAPDGRTVIYAASWQGQPAQLFTTRLDSTESTALPLPAANLASVSATGMLAILLPRQPAAVVAEVSLAGGAPRELVDGMLFSLPFAPAVADWSPAGGGLAVVRRGQLEFPAGKVLLPGSYFEGVQSVRFSPDGRRIAFLRGNLGRYAVGVTDLAGRQTILCDGLEFASSLAWHPGTGEIWFSARERNTRFGVIEIQAVSLSGKRRVVARAPTLLTVEDVAPGGSVLVRSDDWPTTMMCLPPGASREVDLSWLDFSTGVDLSGDGRDLLFTESGAAEGANGGVYLRKTDGSAPAVRLGDGQHVAALSPDRRWVVQVWPDRLVLLPVGPGDTRTIRDEGLEYQTAAWFPDGKRLLVQARSGGKPARLYERDLAAGPPRALTPEGFGFRAMSPDGKTVAVRDRDHGASLFSVEDGAQRRVPGSRPEEEILNFDAQGKSVFVARMGFPMRIERLDLASGIRSFWKEIALSDPTGFDHVRSVRLTPDGACYCYTFMRSLSRLYAVEGLR